MLLTPCIFVVLSAPMDWHWHALRLRENIHHTYKACHRNCHQRKAPGRSARWEQFKAAVRRNVCLRGPSETHQSQKEGAM